MIRGLRRNGWFALAIVINALIASAAHGKSFRETTGKFYFIGVNVNHFHKSTKLSGTPKALITMLDAVERLAVRAGYRDTNIHFYLFEDKPNGEPIRKTDNTFLDDYRQFEPHIVSPDGDGGAVTRLPTTSNLFAVLNSKTLNAHPTDPKETDLVILYISTHGVEQRGHPVFAMHGYNGEPHEKEFSDKNDQRRSNNTGAADDPTKITSTEHVLALGHIINAVRDLQQRVLIFIDTCRTAAEDQGKGNSVIYRDPGPYGNTSYFNDGEKLWSFVKDSDKISLFASASSGEFSYTHPLGSDKPELGVFTKVLADILKDPVKKMEEYSKIDKEIKGAGTLPDIDALNLSRMLAVGVEEITSKKPARQNPVYWSSKAGAIFEYRFRDKLSFVYCQLNPTDSELGELVVGKKAMDDMSENARTELRRDLLAAYRGDGSSPADFVGKPYAHLGIEILRVSFERTRNLKAYLEDKIFDDLVAKIAPLDRSWNVREYVKLRPEPCAGAGQPNIEAAIKGLLARHAPLNQDAPDITGTPRESPCGNDTVLCNTRVERGSYAIADYVIIGILTPPRELFSLSASEPPKWRFTWLIIHQDPNDKDRRNPNDIVVRQIELLAPPAFQSSLEKGIRQGSDLDPKINAVVASIHDSILPFHRHETEIHCSVWPEPARFEFEVMLAYELSLWGMTLPQRAKRDPWKNCGERGRQQAYRGDFAVMKPVGGKLYVSAVIGAANADNRILETLSIRHWRLPGSTEKVLKDLDFWLPNPGTFDDRFTRRSAARAAAAILRQRGIISGDVVTGAN